MSEDKKVWRDPLLQYLAENTQSPLDRPPLVRPRLRRIGYVPQAAIDCTLADVAAWYRDGTIYGRLNLTGNRSPRIAFNLNLFDWRPWGVLRHAAAVTAKVNGGTHPDPTYDGGHVSYHTPGAGMGCSMILRNALSNYRAWLWTTQIEKDEDVYLTRRMPRAAA